MFFKAQISIASINRLDWAPYLGISSTSKLDVIPICKFLCAKRQLCTDAPFRVKARATHKILNTLDWAVKGICSFAALFVWTWGVVVVVILSCTEKFRPKMSSLPPEWWMIPGFGGPNSPTLIKIQLCFEFFFYRCQFQLPRNYCTLLVPKSLWMSVEGFS